MTNIPSKISKQQIIEKAVNFHLEGNIQEASKYYQYCISRGFNDHKVFSNYGTILIGLGKLKEAEESIRKAIELKPDYSIAYSNLGNILKELGKLKEAEESIRKAIELKPDYSIAYSNLGNILKKLGKLKEAEEFMRKAIELKPDFVEAYSNLGNILKELGKLKAAEVSTRKALELDFDFADAHNNLGDILRELGNLQEAELCTRKAIELKSDFAEAHFNLAYLQLLNEDYQSGLENYEFRFNTEEPAIIYGSTKLKRVKNEKLKKGEKLLLISEQGLGDTLQYMRYVPYLRTLGLDVSFCAHKKLHTLIKSSGIDQQPLNPEQVNQITEGKWIPLLSLPKYLKVNPKKPIITNPYIFPSGQLVKKWENILSNEERPIVGINWQGNPEMEKTYRGRSFPLENFSEIFNQNKITLLSLQKGFGSEQLDDCSFKNKFVECQPLIDQKWDFNENAAIIENCDLIITCDTSIAHLAGGMGKKVWLLLKDIPFWTWGLKEERTFWYPSMRLFRQKERNNWKKVMISVSRAIKKEMYAKS
ncbi:tetratricopeptide repeat protein [Prochlorococcus marinus]|uniref:tetratricopeptide repeat protein n=1 Tax=Prochlorococcus marinus TaxID=1219 RepID=UPI0022B570A1|nr:tetratricopeptide repeat protein [Prochlorococcus marinus]